MTNNPFPGHRTYPTDVAVFEQHRGGGVGGPQLHDAMTAMKPEYRWLATSMMSDEIGDILKMIQVDQQQFSSQGLRDMSDQWVTRQATEDEVRDWHERQR